MKPHTLTAGLAMGLCLGLATSTLATPVWFDEAPGGAGHSSFLSLADAYRNFMTAPEQTITFNDLAANSVLGEQYASSLGVHFRNTGAGRYAGYSRVHPEDDANVEALTGYDGSYMPNGDKVFLKFDNDIACSPFTIAFDEPVASLGAFVGMGVQGGVHSLSISLFDAQDSLIDRRTVNSWLWEAITSRQNYESFFGVRMSAPVISRVEILNDARTDFANALTIDNVGFSRAPGPVPEPAPLLFLLATAGLLATGRPLKGVRA